MNRKLNNRRTALTVAAACAASLGWPALRAQPSTKPIRVGLLLSGSPAQWAPLEQALVAGLRERGYVEGSNLVLLRRYGELQGERIRSGAAELSALQVDTIVTSCTGTTRMAAQASPNTPIVMGSMPDPVGAGFAASLSRPGGKITGRGGLGLELIPKRLEVLRILLTEQARAGARIGVLMNGQDPANDAAWHAAEPAAKSLDLVLVRIEANGPAGLDSAFQTIANANLKGLLVFTDDPVMIEHRERIVAMALRLRLPSISSHRLFAEAGGLISFGADMSDDYRQSAAHVVKVANGTDPATLPIEQPTRFPMTINMKTADALGIKIPPALQIRADAILQ